LTVAFASERRNHSGGDKEMNEEKSRMTRRKLLLVAVAAACGAGGAARAEQKPGGLRKRTREQVRYQNEPYLGRSCGKCVLYQGEGVCVILDGAVSPDGWCTQWVPATVG
jgi:hypothetical protein